MAHRKENGECRAHFAGKMGDIGKLGQLAIAEDALYQGLLGQFQAIGGRTRGPGSKLDISIIYMEHARLLVDGQDDIAAPSGK